MLSAWKYNAFVAPVKLTSFCMSYKSNIVISRGKMGVCDFLLQCSHSEFILIAKQCWCTALSPASSPTDIFQYNHQSGQIGFDTARATTPSTRLWVSLQNEYWLFCLVLMICGKDTESSHGNCVSMVTRDLWGFLYIDKTIDRYLCECFFKKICLEMRDCRVTTVM